jgi:molybdopterin converting factor small subunit
VATVVLGREIARRFTGGETTLSVVPPPATVQALIRSLDERFPGLGAALGENMAVAIDGVIFQGAPLQPLAGVREICFIPAIEGG